MTKAGRPLMRRPSMSPADASMTRIGLRANLKICRTVDRDRRSAAGCRLFGRCEDERQVAIDIDIFGFADDKRAVKAARRLPDRVIPISSRVRRDETAVKTLSRRDRRLCERGRTIHGIGEPDAVPVYRRGLCHLVDDAQ